MNLLTLMMIVALGDTTICHNDPSPSTIGTPGPSYAVQYYFAPSRAGWHRLNRWGFVSNDDATVWLGAGGLVIMPDSLGKSRFPTPLELSIASGMTPPFQAPTDTSLVIVDLQNEWVVIPPYSPDAALVAVLAVPSGQPDTTMVGLGTGFLMADKLGTECSFFTPDGVDWYVITNKEWAWAAEISQPTTSSTPFIRATWGLIKELFK